MRSDDDLADLPERDLLELAVLELRALRRLIGTIFIVVVVLALVAPLVAGFVASK